MSRPVIIASAAAAALAWTAFGAAPACADQTAIRVSIRHHEPETVIASEGGLTVRAPDQQASSPYVAADVTTVLDIRPSGDGGLILAGQIRSGPTLLVAAAGPEGIAVDGERYRGSAIVQNDGDGTLDVVNVVDLEDYLYGVVGREMEASWPAAALEAQAIVARTYAVAHFGTREWLGYDLLANEADQAYGGVRTETPSVIASVDATRGSVLVYGPALVHAYYSSCDGGYTSDGSALGDEQAYLRAAPDRFCALSPDERWSADVPLDAFAAAFAQRYGAVGRIVAVEAGPADASGRLTAVTVRGDADVRTIPATAFRALAGNHVVKSTRIDDLEVTGSSIHVNGSGFGHGVGMAQWGARSMAVAGWSAHEILAYYYPGATYARIADAIGH